MRPVRLLLALLFVSYVIGSSVPAHATNQVQNDVVISQIQPGTLTAASQEYVSIYNNTDTDIDLTNWCLRYNGSNSKPGCIDSPDQQTVLMLAARTYTTFASNEFTNAHPGFVPQARVGFSGGMSDSSGTLTLVSPDGTVSDQFAWSAKVGAGKIFQRRMSAVAGMYENTGNNTIDFMQSELAIPSNLGLYEQAIPLDLCPNLAGRQDNIPSGYEQNQGGNCLLDVCTNLIGLQSAVPAGYTTDGLGLCVLMPLESATLDITEILPNAPGTDAGKEFVELHNPNNRPIDLHGYVIAFGPDFTKLYPLPDVTIQPSAYRAFSDTQMGFVLPNTSMSLRLISPKGEAISTSNTYVDPLDDLAWALIEGVWQFTDNPTPGGANLAMTLEDQASSPVTAAASSCAAGKYRNPETNRCRAIEKVVSSVIACDEDEYRNPETNRCRKLGALSGVTGTACKVGQERNPATNRCRAITTDAGLETAACDEGQERSPETNRCRKVSAPTQGPQQTPNRVSEPANAGLITGIALATLGYALYEYRYDVINLYLRLRQGILGKKLG